MGGRGSSNNGALGAGKLLGPGGAQLSLEDLAKLLGFGNKNKMLGAQEMQKLLNGKSDGGRVAKYLAEHGGHGGSLGPIMLRIGLPRDKLLDIFHALKPLHDHGILTATMPLSYKQYEDPFQLAAHTTMADEAAVEALLQTQFRIPDGASYLRRLANLPINFIVGTENNKHKK